MVILLEIKKKLAGIDQRLDVMDERLLRKKQYVPLEKINRE